MKLIQDKDIENFRKAGKHLAQVLEEVKAIIAPGVSTRDLDDLAYRKIKELGDTPAFLDYQPDGARRPFPATLCVSVNDEIVHGIPNENQQVLKEGDIVGLDIGLIHEGMVVDMAVTVPVGKIDETAEKLLEVTKKSLNEAIKICKPGNFIGDIGEVIEKTVEGTGFSIVEELGGHGVGYKVHDEPYIPNFKDRNKGPKIVPGMGLALEPILNEGKRHVVLEPDGYTFKTADGKRSAHFEHTILITEKGPEVITIL